MSGAAPSRALIIVDHGDQEKGAFESDHLGRFERRQDVADEPVYQQEVHQPVQGDHRRRFPDQRSDGRRSARYHAGEATIPSHSYVILIKAAKLDGTYRLSCPESVRNSWPSTAQFNRCSNSL